ncbi:glutamate--cysteine ligase [Actinomadura viridis]
MKRRTFGVEEEFLLVDPVSGSPRALSGAVIRCARDQDGQESRPGVIDTELQREQLETDTPPCSSLEELSDRIREARRTISLAAAEEGAAVAALATCPVRVRPSLTPSRRYRRMADEYAMTADEQLTCGCHVHVRVESPEEGVAVLDRIRPWLPPLLALSGNSPFWQGRDTGYASWRQQVWWRWPSSGPTEPFGSPEGYRRAVKALLDTGALLDEGMIYFDARLSRRYPTVEIRVADVCLRPGDTVLLAALARALVEVAARSWREGREPDPVRTDLLRMAMWRASRSGMDEDLVHPVTRHSAPAREVVGALLDHAAPALERYGDLATAERLLERLVEEGNGARRQRAVYERTGDMGKVVADAVQCTSP